MYSSNYNYRPSTSPYRAPSKNANTTFEYGGYRPAGGGHNRDIYDETWPLDEVIDKIDLKSESDFHDDSPLHHSTSSRKPNTMNASSYSFGEPYRSKSPQKSPTRFGRVGSPDPDMVYSAFPDRTQSSTWTTSFNSGNYNKHNNSYEPYKHRDSSGYKPYDPNNNYMSDDQWSLDDYNKSPMVRDVAIQCNLKKYQQSLHAAVYEPSVERVVTQKPPIKVIKSSPSGLVSTFSSVPKLQSTGMSSGARASPYPSELDFDSYEPSPQSDVIYTQVDKKPSRPMSSKLNSSVNSNLNVVFKTPMNPDTSVHNSSIGSRIHNDNKMYDIRSKEYGFSVNTPAMPRVNLHGNNSYDNNNRHLFNSSRDLNELSPAEKEVLEETISISNASEDSYRIGKPTRGYNHSRDRDDLSYTGLSVASGNSSNYRHASPSRYERYTSKAHQSPFGTIEKNRDAKTKIKKKKSSRKVDQENVLLSNNSLRLKSSKNGPASDRLYKSNADLREPYAPDETRGGLAAAYKHRQQLARTPTSDRPRALSLSRMSSAWDDPEEHRSDRSQTSRQMSHMHLGGRGSRLSDSSTGTFQRSASRGQLHERDPIVMYIPTASRDSPVKQHPSGILRNNSTKSSLTTATLPSKGKKAAEARSKSSKDIKATSRANMRESEKEEKKSSKTKDKKSKDKKQQQQQQQSTSQSAIDLSRSQSMPKDTKFNWLSKLKLKSK